MLRLRSSRRPRALDVICVGGFLLSVVYPLALTPIEPSLLAVHPILVETILGTVESLVTAGAFARVGRAALWLAIMLPLFGGDLLDPFSWWVGRRYGRRILTSERGGGRYRAAVIRGTALFQRWGPWTLVLAYYLPLPNALMYIAAGESGMSLWRFIVLDLIGRALGIVPFILMGFAVGQSAVNLAELVTRYAGISTAVLVVLVLAYLLVRARQAGGQSSFNQEAPRPR